MRLGSTAIMVMSLAVGLYLLAPMLALAIRGYLEVAGQLAGR